jgi:threonine aldolase
LLVFAICFEDRDRDRPPPWSYDRRPVPDVVNLYSDTQTRPTPGMREAIAGAEVGDEQRGEDPTVNALQERVAELLGHEAALFLPSGTMCNAIAFRLHIRPGGDAALLDRTAHPLHFEAGSPAQLSGAMIIPLDGAGGIFTAGQLSAALAPGGDRYAPRSRLVSVEQTTNIAGGRVWPLATIGGVLDVARGAGLRAHLDGARLLNAVVASGVSAADYARPFDTAWIDFTKGLGAPVGACLAGSRELIDEAWRYKQMWGGAMRQAGIVAAAGLYALDHHVDRLAEDHANARWLAEALAEIDGVDIDPTTVETNILVAGVADTPALVAALDADGVQITPLGPATIRMVTHLDVDRAGCERAAAAIRRALAS